MNLAKRACLYLVRKKGKTATLLAFLLVMATLMLTCLSIQSATETANANIKKALMGYFTINAKQLQTGITEDTLNQILSIDGLSGNYTLLILTQIILMQTENLSQLTRKMRLRFPKAMKMQGELWQIRTQTTTVILQTAALSW